MGRTLEPSRSIRSRNDAFVANRLQRQELPKLPFQICIAIHRFLASATAPPTPHRVAEGGPVTYIFLGRANASLFLFHYASAPDMTTSMHSGVEDSSDAPATDLPLNALTLHGEWLELILNGRKTWEIRSSATKKRERVALAQSTTSLLLGDVEIVNCLQLNAQSFAASMHKHCVPLQRHNEIIGGYATTNAWELAKPRRYLTPIKYTRLPGQVSWVDLRYQQRIFMNMRFVHTHTDDPNRQLSQHNEPALEDIEPVPSVGASALEPSRPDSLTQFRRQVAAATAEARAAVSSARGIGEPARAQAMQEASQASSSHQGDAPFGTNRSWKLREDLTRARATAKATLIPPQALPPVSQSASAHPMRPPLLNITPLQNLRNTCFLNTIIQTLRVVCNRLNMNVQPEHACPLSRLLISLDGARDDFKRRVKTHPIWKELHFGQQHDAHEAIRLLLDFEHRMHSACTEQSCLARKLATQFTVNCFSHVTCTAATCTWNSSPPPEPGADVSMAVRLGDLQTLVGDFEMPEFLTAHDDYVCQACGDLVQKNIRVQPRGRALLLHLKRFDNVGRKRSDLVIFPRILHFGTARYEFVSLVEHIGPTLAEGHYVAYVQSHGF